MLYIVAYLGLVVCDNQSHNEPMIYAYEWISLFYTCPLDVDDQALIEAQI